MRNVVSVFKDAVMAWLSTAKELDCDEIPIWCLTTMIMIGSIIGFVALLCYYPIPAIFVFVIVILPILMMIYAKNSDNNKQ